MITIAPLLFLSIYPILAISVAVSMITFFSIVGNLSLSDPSLLFVGVFGLVCPLIGMIVGRLISIWTFPNYAKGFEVSGAILGSLLLYGDTSSGKEGLLLLVLIEQLFIFNNIQFVLSILGAICKLCTMTALLIFTILVIPELVARTLVSVGGNKDWKGPEYFRPLMWLIILPWLMSLISQSLIIIFNQ